MRNIIVYLDVEYEKNWYRDLFKALVESDCDLNILAVERPITLLGLVWSLGRNAGKARSRHERIINLRPLSLVHDRIAYMFRPLARLNKLVIERQLRRLVRGRVDAAWIFHPYQLDYLRYLAPAAKIYQVYDDYYFREWDRAMIRRLEESVLAAADVVYVASPALLPGYNGRHDNVKLMPNSVSERFKLSCTKDALCAELAKLRRPRICTWGYISDRLDFGLVRQLAKHNPAWSFVFLGECGRQARPLWNNILKQCPNIRHYDRLDWANLAGYLQEMDVLFIPHVRNDFNAAASPVRFIQALAIGKPVIVPELPYSEPHRDMVYFAEKADEYAEHINRLLKQGEDSALNCRRIKYADDHSWENKAGQIKQEICA
jgi:hypothetical protein